MENQWTDGLVSVITPLYNGEQYIAQAIQSVVHQTYTKWEMIIVDDGSTDRSVKIVRENMQADERIRFIQNSGNQGVVASRNKAIENARGQYIAFLDSDDCWLPEKLTEQIRRMQEANTGLCYGNCNVIDKNGNIRGKDRIAPATVNYKKLLYGNPIPCVTVLLDRNKVGQIQMPNIGHEDYATWLTILKRIPQGCGTGTTLAQYRVNEQSLSGNKVKAAKWQWRIYREYLELSLGRSCLYFIGYVYHAIRKRV